MKTLVWETIGNTIYSRSRTPTGWWVRAGNTASAASFFLPDEAGAWLKDDVVVVQPPPPATKPIGMNLAAVTDYAAQVAFSDMFKQSRGFVSHGPYGSPNEWDNGKPITLRPDGYPASLASGQLLGSLMAWNTGPNAWPSGHYEVTYAGTGTLELRAQSGNVSVTTANVPGKLSFDYDNAQGGVDLVITATDPANPIRDIKVLRVGSVDGFDPRFIDVVKPFGAVRFMDWQQTNNSTVKSWSERTAVSGKQTGRAGVAIEHMVNLCNAADVDAWFCMPHMADDDFVRRFATQVFQTLEPARKVHVEFSNECWNSIFTQSAYCIAQGVAAGLPGNQWEAGWRWYTKRSLEIFAIWKSVFGTDQRLVRVLSFQAQRTGATPIILEGVSSANADVFAIAAYIGGGVTSAASASALLADVMSEANGTKVMYMAGSVPVTSKDVLTLNKAMAEAKGLRLMAYEGGIHLRDNTDMNGGAPNSALTTMFLAANADPALQAIYATHLALWKSIGGATFMAFDSVEAWSKFGSWGHMRHFADLSSPKMLAVKDALKL